MKDVLSDVLDSVNLQGTLYFRTDFSPPFANSIPAYKQAARFHLVVQGQCHVTIPSGETALLRPGDLILVPNGNAHVLADAANRIPASLETVMATAGYSGAGTFVVGTGDPTASTQLVCGHFTFAEGIEHPLLRSLPTIIHLTAGDRANRPLLDDILRLITRRMFNETPGQAASVSRLSEVLYIEALLACADYDPELKLMLSAVTDRQIGRALSLIHHQIGRDWTVGTLASEAGMSRSRFAERFRELVGTSPIEYISNWRLQRAQLLLSEPRASVKEIAYKIGYKSPAAFSRAFSRKFGRPPATQKIKTG